MKGADKNPRLFSFNSTARADFAACRAEVAAILADHCVRTARRAFPAMHQGKAMRIDFALRDTLGYFFAFIGYSYRMRRAIGALARKHARRYLVTFCVEKTSTIKNLLDRIR